MVFAHDAHVIDRFKNRIFSLQSVRNTTMNSTNYHRTHVYIVNSITVCRNWKLTTKNSFSKTDRNRNFRYGPSAKWFYLTLVVESRGNRLRSRSSEAGQSERARTDTENATVGGGNLFFYRTRGGGDCVSRRALT